jgi:hypothetical protein
VLGYVLHSSAMRLGRGVRLNPDKATGSLKEIHDERTWYAAVDRGRGAGGRRPQPRWLIHTDT